MMCPGFESNPFILGSDHQEHDSRENQSSLSRKQIEEKEPTMYLGKQKVLFYDDKVDK